MITSIIAPIKTGDTGAPVANLQDALLVLLEQKIIRSLDVPNRPTLDELQKLTAALKVERAQSLFGKATLQLLRYFQVQQGLGDNLRGAVEEKTAAKINELLKSIGALGDDTTSVVRGTVKTADNKPISGASVILFDRDLRKLQQFGQIKTNELGEYVIFSGPAQFARGDVPGAKTPRLIARAFVGDQQVGDDVSRPNPSREEVVDFRMPAPMVSEWEKLTTDVIPLLDGQGKDDQALAPWDVNDSDLYFLAEETGLDREKIRLWTLAFAVGRDTTAIFQQANVAGATTHVAVNSTVTKSGSAFAIFYGWFRLGLSTEPAVLWSTPTETLLATLNTAIAKGIVPAAVGADPDGLSELIEQIKADRILQAPAMGTATTLGDLLATSPAPLSLDQQRVIATAAADLRPDDPGLVKLIATMPGMDAEGVAAVVARTLRLGALTGGHLSLTQALQAKADATQPDSIEFLTALNPTDWIELVFEHGVPPRSALDNDGFIAQLQSGVESKFPMVMLGKQLDRKPDASENFPAGKIVDFLKLNPSFDLGKQQVEPYLRAIKNQDDALRVELLQLQRVHALTGNARETGILLEAGFGSAIQIISGGQSAFARQVAGQVSADRAEEIFVAANNVVTAVVALGTAYAPPPVTGRTVVVIPPQKTASEETLNNYPSLRTLFGDLDYCECRHCQSVLGPAAYLADLLHFLQRSPLVPRPDGNLSLANYDYYLNPYLEYAAGGTVLGALLQRRPDLADLELSCENTETQIPYIDLVLEILENAVALPMAVTVNGVDIEAEFSAGNVPAAVADALHQTDIEVGKVLHVTPDLHLGTNSSLSSWVITDGSRRWLVQHLRPQFIVFSSAGNFQVLDVAAAVTSLQQGKFDAELEDKLSQGIPLVGAPQINAQTISGMSAALLVWKASYTRSIAVKISMGNPVGAVELLNLDGTQFAPPRQWQWSSGVIQVIAHAFTPGATSKINPNVATLLGLPANESYLQTWNPTQNWWELSVNDAALFIQILEGLNVSGLTYQNSSVHEHLESSPENRNPTAYNILSRPGMVFPWALPFDLWLEETRAFLEAIGVPRATLIDLARPQSRLSEEAAALELLGLSKSEADLITAAPTSTQPWTYWGLAELTNSIADQTAGAARTGSWLEVLRYLSMLLQQSGLSYREYLDLLQTGFVYQPKLILFPPNECQTSNIILTGLSDAQLTDHLSRVHVFTRLWRRSGWSMRDLDLALIAFGGQITPAMFQDLALLQRLVVAVGMPVSTLLACVDQLGTDAWTDHTEDSSSIKPAAYDSVFQRQSLRSLTGFQDFASENLVNAALTISGHADFIAASLGIKPDQLNAWISGTPNLGLADLATLENLSRLYAATVLCRALQISPDNLPDILLLLGPAADPFHLPAGTAPEDDARARARAWLECAERSTQVRNSGFDFAILSYLLRHTLLSGGADDARIRIEQQLTQTLTDIRSVLQSGAVLGDVSADNLRRQLARLGWYPSLIDEAMGTDGLANQPGASVDIIPPLTSEPAIPLNLRSKFSYQKLDPTKATLKCAGSLVDSDFASIDNLNLFPAGSVAALKAKYIQLLQDGVAALANLLQIIELPEIPTVTAPLTTLTALPVISGELKDRLTFTVSPTAATAGNLSLTGWLSDDETQALSTANPPLSAAFRSLQTQALNKIPAPSGKTLADAELILREPGSTERHRAILLRLVPHLELDLVTAQLSSALGLDQPSVSRLLDLVIPNLSTGQALLTDPAFLRSDPKSPVDRASWPDQFAVLELLGKIATIASRLAVRPDQWDWLLGGSFSVLDVRTFPVDTTHPTSFDGWRQLVDLFRLREVLPDGPTRLARIYTALTTQNFAAERNEFAEAFELEAAAVDEMNGACSAGLLAFSGAAPAKDYANPSRLLALAQLLHVIKELGTTAPDLSMLIQAAPDETVAQLARKLFAASVNASLLPERMRPISDRLRQLQRDALVAYLINRDHLADANDLFDRYLIDVEMSSCMLTSRIKQAISSVQLFVQRCLLNLEPATASSPGVSPAAIDSRRWQWMKYYRVWEANRKVFLYPENWIEPELRDDKTELFETFESDLLQSDLTTDTALGALQKYLEGLGEVANITVVALFEEQTDDGGSTVHIAGRDNSEPYHHYYRQWKLPPGGDYGSWTAWEAISAQVDSEHVQLFVHSGDVYLAWPTFTGQGDQNWQLHMNLGKRSSTGWSKIKKSRGNIVQPMIADHDERDSFAFRLAFDVPQNIALLRCYARSVPKGQVQLHAESYVAVPGAASLRTLSLQVRTLAKYTDQSGKIFYYVASDFNSTCVITFTYNVANVAGRIPGITVVPLSKLNGGNGELLSRLDLPSVFLTVEFVDLTIKSNAPSQRYLNSSFSKTQLLDQNVTWSLDIVFDLQTDQQPEQDSSQSDDFDYIDSFKLADDNSFEIYFESFSSPTDFPAPLGHPADTEHFISGYREAAGEYPLILDGSLQALATTPGQYFIVQSQASFASAHQIWAYRDDQFSLLFWKNRADAKYRVVPFTTLGMTALATDVARGKLLDAVALPLMLPGGPLSPLPLAVNSMTTPDINLAKSVTQVTIDFGPVPTSIYNWEVFFHNPLLVATQLSQAQRFEEAQSWFHLIFDPTTNDTGQNPSRYWRFLPLREAGQGNAIDELLKKLAQGDISLRDPINEWEENPFRPHLIARHRLRSYQFAVVQKYLENLIAWGDQLFLRDTIESINEATQLYVLATRILGKRPATSPKQGALPKSYRDIYRKLDDFSNAWVPLEGPAATALFSASVKSSLNNEQTTGILNSLGSLYFCVPGNEKLSEFWDTVEDRLFKIRHCMNLEGLVRQLPLFEPPIDPALLVRATAAGLDLAAVLAGLDAPLPLYRFTQSVQKALELCSEVRALGNSLLSALEKKDSEQLALLRSGHEIQMLKLARAVKELQQSEAENSLDALRKTREISAQRYLNFQRLMGRQNIAVPAEGEVAALESSTLQLAPPNAGGSDTQGLALTAAESGHLGWLNDANNYSLVAGGFAVMAGIFHTFPDITASVSIGLISASTTGGGSHLGAAASAVQAGFGMAATHATFLAGQNATIGSHQRRYDEWRFQSNVAAKELEQIDQQILGNQIRVQMAVREIANHDQQIANAQEDDEFMRDKFTNQQLYSWMVGQLSGVYFRTYQLAHDLSKRVERSYRFELGLADSNFIEVGYWDSLKQGLLCGERLYLDLKRMEAAYLDKNKREYEITKHVSVLQLDPLALLQLKEIGTCDINLPEVLFDLDFPGHFLRRIKSVSLTIPCVTGPYSGVPCTLTLLKHSVRQNSSTTGNYARDVENDDSRFADSFGAIQSIVTSSAQNDPGMFETNLRDERYLPFEGTGAISGWRIELPKQFKPFDYETISDVVLHVRYTAKDGGDALRQKAGDELAVAINNFIRSEGQQGFARAFSVRHEFPVEWSRFLNPPESINPQTLAIKIDEDRFPFLFRGRTIAIKGAGVILKFKEITDPVAFRLDQAAPTPLGDYKAQNETPLKLNLIPPVTPPNPVGLTLASSDAFLNGLPYAATDFQTGRLLGAWSLEFKSDDIEAIAASLRDKITVNGNDIWRLKATLIEDICLVYRYSV